MHRKLTWSIAKFRRGNEEFAGLIDITHIPFDEIWRITEPDADDPEMFYDYRLSSGQLAAFQDHVSERFDIAKYDYIIGASPNDKESGEKKSS